MTFTDPESRHEQQLLGELEGLKVSKEPTRTYEEQKKLYDRWQARKNPEGVNFAPGHSIHRDPSWSEKPLDEKYPEPWHIDYSNSREFRLWDWRRRITGR